MLLREEVLLLYKLLKIKIFVLLEQQLCDNPNKPSKSASPFLSTPGMSHTKLSLGGNNLYITSIFPPRESLVSEILAGDGNIEKLFTVYVRKTQYNSNKLRSYASLPLCWRTFALLKKNLFFKTACLPQLSLGGIFLENHP